jgi:intracellular sulfur oxidation DsrE/DsrF family protein
MEMNQKRPRGNPEHGMIKTMKKPHLTMLLGLFMALANATTAAPSNQGPALKPMPEIANEPKTERFPGDPAEHKVVYMFNQADLAYQTSVLNSIQAMIKTYGDNVSIAVVAIGPGIHVLANSPKRAVDKDIADRIDNFAKSYKVRFIACGNTMATVGYAQGDMKPFAEYALVGAAALMRLQETGHKAIFW